MDVDEKLAPHQVYQRFVDAGVAPKTQPQRETPGYLSQLGSALGLGYRQMKSGLGATFNAATGDVQDTAAAMAEMGALQREQEANLTPEDVALNEAFARNEAEYNASQGLFDSTKALSGYVGSTLAHPGAAFKQVVQSAPNALVGGATELGGYALGGLVGAGAGIETGPGAIATGIAGAMAGGAASNTLLEAGPAIFDILNERTNGAASSMTADQIAQVLQKNPDIMSEGLKTGAIRGSVIGAIEGLGMKGAGSLLTIPERAAARAMQKTLVDAGVDVASKKAVEKALLDPALRTAAATAAETAKKQFTSAGNLARFAGGAAIETGSAGAGELGAQVATGQQISPTGVFQEMLGEAGMSLPLAGATKAWEARKYLAPKSTQDQLTSSIEGVINNADVAPLTAQVLANESPDATPAGSPVSGDTETEEIPGIGAINRADLAGIPPAEPPVANEPPSPESLVGDAGAGVTGDAPEIPLADRPSPNLAPRSTNNVPPRPPRQGRDTSARDVWDEQYGNTRKGGKTHNEDGTPYQPTVYDEVAPAIVVARQQMTDEEANERIGDWGEARIGTSIRTLINAGWTWDAVNKQWQQPANNPVPNETPAQAIIRLQGQTQPAAAPSAPSTPQPAVAPAKQSAAEKALGLPAGTLGGRNVSQPQITSFYPKPRKYDALSQLRSYVKENNLDSLAKELNQNSELRQQWASILGIKPNTKSIIHQAERLAENTGENAPMSDEAMALAKSNPPFRFVRPSIESPREYVSSRDANTETLGEMTLTEDYGGKFYYFNRLVSKIPNKGGGSKALRELQDYSDFSQIPILNEVSAYGDKSQDDLIKWYQDRGFVPFQNSKNTLVYWPREASREAIAKFQPQTTQTNATNQRNQPEIVREEPENGTQGREAAEAGARNRVQRETTGAEIQKEVITPQGKPTTATEGKVMPGGSAVERVEVIPEDYARAQANAEKGGTGWGDVETNEQPIKAYRKPDGQLKMYDGHHRLVNAQQKGKKTIPVSIDGEGVVDVPLSAFQTEQYGRPDLKREVSQTTAAETQTPVPSRKGTGAAGVVQSETGKGSILPDDETKETPYKEESRGKVEATGYAEKLNSVRKILRTGSNSAKAQNESLAVLKAMPVGDLQDAFNVLTGDTTKLTNRTQLANNILNEILAQEQSETAPTVAGVFSQAEQEMEQERKAQAKLTESRRNSLDSIIGKPQEVEMNAVSVGDGRESLAMVHNSGDVPGVLNAFVGTSKDFLANPENEKNFPGLYRLLKGGQVDEGNFAYGRAFVFTDGIGINAVDRANAVKLGVTPAVAAVRRVLIHESLVHRGIFGLPAHLQRKILQWVQQNTTPEQLDVLAKTYPRYADWRLNENQLLALCEEFLAKKVEKLTTISKSGPLARLMDILSDIWRWITGNTGEPTIKNLKDVVKLLKAGSEAADARLVNGGKIKMSQLRAQGFVTPEMDKAYMDAVQAGDMEKAQRMVDEAAKKNGGRKVTHFKARVGNRGFLNRSTWAEFKLTEDEINELPELLEYGLEQPRGATGKFFFTEDGLKQHSRLIELARKISRPGVIREDGYLFEAPNWESSDGQLSADPNQIKSADPVTRDDAGNVIPLSQRFNAASPDIRASYIGEGAIKNFPEERRQFMRDSLDAAKAMAAAGKSSEEIRAATGWFPGKYDGKLRFEISDNQAAYRERIGAYTKVKNWLYGKLSDESMEGTMVGIPLRQILDFPELYEAYPQIKKIKVDLEERSGAAFLPESNTIALSLDDTPAKRLSYLLHELQHWIQTHEGFAKGASPKGFGFISKQAFDEYQRTAGEIEARDIQSRKDLTPEQRAATEPYSSENIAPEDAIVLFGNQGVQESRPTYANPIDAQLANAAERMRAMREREAAPPVPKALARLFDTNAQPTGTANKLFQTAQAPESGKLGDIEAMSPENVDWSLTQLDGRMRQDALGVSYEHYKNANVADQWYRYLANKVLSEDALMELNSMYAEMNPNAQFVERDLPRAAFKTGDISELTPEQTSWILLNADGEDRQRLLGVTRKHYSDAATADQWANYLAGKVANDPEAMAELSAMHQEMNPNAREEEVTPLDNIKRIVSESLSRSEVESLLKDLNTEEIKEVVRSIGYPTQGTKADNIRRILSFVGSRADAIAIRGINPINLNAPTIVRTPEQQAAFDEELRLAKERANELDISLPQKKPLYDQEKWNRNMAAIMAPSSVAPQKIRNEIRAAYDRASAKISDIWVPFQAVYDEVKKSFPSLTEREFGEQVQLLYEMDSAVVQNFLPSTADVLASGDKWGVYYNTGLGSASPASSMLVMPEIKASRQEKENVDTAIHSTRGMKGKVDNIIKELPANSFTGKPLQDAVSQSFAPLGSDQFYADIKPIVIKSLDDMVKRGVDDGNLLETILDPRFAIENFQGWNPAATAVVSHIFFAEALNRAVKKQDQLLADGDIVGYNLQQQKIDAWSKFNFSDRNEWGVIGNAIQKVMNDPEYQGLYLLSNFRSQKIKQEQEVTDSSMKDPVKAAEEIDKAGKDSKDDADEAVSDAAEELSLEDLIRDGEASLSDAEKSLWQRAKEYMVHLGAIAKAEIQAAFTGKASNAISASDLVKHYIAMPKDKRDKEKARFKKELNDVLGKLIGDKTTAKGKKKGDLVEAFEKKRSRESIKDKVFGPDEQKAFKALIRKLNAARPGETTPLARVSSWKALFEMTPTDQGMMKGRMFDTIKNDPAFDNLTPEEQQKLATLLEKAWDKRREQFLTRELDRIIRTQNMSKKAAKALEQRPAILRKIDSGVFDYENLAALVGEQYGIKNLTPQEAKRVKEISSELGQDLMPHQRTKLQDELQELMVSKNLSLGEMIKAWWITAVLTGPRTAFTIGLSFMTGGFELVGHSMSVLANPKMSMQEKSAAISDAIKNWWGSIGREAKAAWMFVLTGDKTIQDPSALMSPQFFDKQFRGNMGRFSFSAAEKMIKSTNPVIRYMGWFMTYAGRILNALDTFNYGITKAGSAPLVYSMLKNAYKPGQMSTSKLVREAKNEIIQKGFDGEAPNASTLNAWARNLAYAKLETITGLAENMNQVAKQGNFTLEPTGFGGLIYNALKHTDAFVQRWAEERVNRMRKDMLKGDNYWIEQRLFNVAEFVQAGLMQVLPILGLQFAKFATNSLNQTISFIPIAGLGRLKEQVDGQAVHNKMIWRNQAIGSAAFMWIYITLKAIEQEPDDEKRGWGIEGDWSNLTPQEKRQRDATGLKENTIWWRNKDGKRVVLNYVNWPVRPLLAAFGSMSDQIKYAPDQWQKGGVMKRGVTTGWAMAKSVLNTSAVSQFTELFGSNIASRDPVEAFTNKAARVFGGYAGGFVPRIIKDIDRWMQPEINKYEGWEYLGKELPFYRRSIGHEYLDVFGKVIAPSQAAWSREMVQQPMEPEYRMLGRLNSRGLWLTPAVAENRLVGKGSHKRPMTDEEAQRYVKAVGQGYREMILRYGDRLLSMPKDRAKDFLAAKSDDVRDRSVKLATRPQ